MRIKVNNVSVMLFALSVVMWVGVIYPRLGFLLIALLVTFILFIFNIIFY